MSPVSPYMKCSLFLLAVLVLLSSGSRAQADKLVTLQQAYAHATRNHPSIMLLQERVRQAEVARYKAWSPLKPTANFQASFTRFDDEIKISFPNPTTGKLDELTFQKYNQFGFTAVAKLPLFVGPAYQGIGIGRKQVKLMQLTKVRSEQDFLLNVAKAYYLVVSQKEVVKALEKKVEVNKKHLEAARARFSVGQSARSMVLRADLVATQDSQKLHQQKNTLKAARRQLAILLGLPGSLEVQRPAEPLSIAPKGRSQVNAALRRRQDFQATELAIRIAEQSRKAAWWGFAPMLDVTWLYRWTEAENFAGNQGTWNLIFTLNLPLYDGGLRYAELRQAKSKIREAEHQKEALALQIEGQVVQLRADVESANAGVISSRKAVELARTTASDMEASFQAGAVTQLDVIDANQRLLDAELGMTGSLFQRDLARLSLAHALGRYDPLKKR